MARIGVMELLVIGGVLLLLLVIAGLVVLILLQRSSRNRPGQIESRQPDARRILDERLARGEIDEQEYDRLRARIDQ